MRPSRVRFVFAGALLALIAAAAVPAAAQSAPEELRITVGKSVVIDYPTDIGRISTSNPDIVDAVAVSTREILLHAKSHGVSTIVVWAKTGQRTFYNITVEHNLEPIRKLLQATFPSENIQVQSARDSVTLIGRVSTQAVSDRAAALTASLAKTVVNNLQVEASAVEKQIVLRVKFAELNRNVSQEFGANLISTGALNTPGRITTGQFSPPGTSVLRGGIPGGVTGTTSEFSLSDALNIFAFRPDLNLAATVRALQSRGLLQILAEPNLVTTNGKEANFLVGGEFPVPVLQGGSNAGAVTIQFREFGIRLTFNPTMTSHGTLRMFVKPEVSTIDQANAVTFSGFRIPALATRRMETNIELGPGQSFVIGGMIDDRVTDTMTKIPGLANIPLLGVLFKSRAENKSKTELIVMVTPEIVEPLNASDPKPLPVFPNEFLGPATPVSSTKPAKEPKTRRAKSRSNDGQNTLATDASIAGLVNSQTLVVRLDQALAPEIPVTPPEVNGDKPTLPQSTENPQIAHAEPKPADPALAQSSSSAPPAALLEEELAQTSPDEADKPASGGESDAKENKPVR